MSRFHDDRSAASDPGKVKLAPGRLSLFPRPLRERLVAWLGEDRFAARISEHLTVGDSRAAVVVSMSPLLVAAYTDELDCVVVLSFPEPFAQRFKLAVGDRLLTVNTYAPGQNVFPDLTPGPASFRRYENFYPLIADFLSDDAARIDARKAAIDEAEWQRCVTLAREYLALRPGLRRDGSPFQSFRPSKAP